MKFIIFGGMTLKEGRQKDGFMEVIGEHYPDLEAKHKVPYRGSKWGEADPGYYNIIKRRFNSLAGRYQVSTRIPPHLFRDLLDRKNLVIIILEHLDYPLRAKGNGLSYGYAARSIAKLKEPLSFIKGDRQKLKGVDDSTEGIIREILKTGTSRFYEGLIYGR